MLASELLHMPTHYHFDVCTCVKTAVKKDRQSGENTFGEEHGVPLGTTVQVQVRVPPTTRHTDTEVLMQPTTLLHNHVNIQRFGKGYKDYFEIFLPNENFMLILMIYFGCCCSPSSPLLLLFLLSQSFLGYFDFLFWLLLLFFFFSFFFFNRLHSCLCPPGLQCAR